MQTQPRSRRAVMVVAAAVILLGSAVLWWDAVRNEQLAVGAVALAACTALAGLTVLLIGLRRA